MTRLHLVTGKGGVGKTRTTLLLQSRLPSARLVGDQSLLDEAQDMHFAPPKIIEFSRQVLAQDFLEKTLRLKALALFLGQSRLIQSLIGLAPNLHELLLLDEWIREAQRSPLLVDAPSTGNFIALFKALETALELFETGSLREMAERSKKFFRTPSNVRVWIVALPEESALAEAHDLHQFLQKHYPEIETSLVLNRIHKSSGPVPGLTDRWLELSEQRPQREAERLKKFEALGHRFELKISEGATAP